MRASGSQRFSWMCHANVPMPAASSASCMRRSLPWSCTPGFRDCWLRCASCLAGCFGSLPSAECTAARNSVDQSASGPRGVVDQSKVASSAAALLSGADWDRSSDCARLGIRELTALTSGHSLCSVECIVPSRSRAFPYRRDWKGSLLARIPRLQLFSFDEQREHSALSHQTGTPMRRVMQCVLLRRSVG
jgi:hypothetical protein